MTNLTEVTVLESVVSLTEPEQVEDEEHWLYGEERSKRPHDSGEIPVVVEAHLPTSVGVLEGKKPLAQDAKIPGGDDEDEDSDSDDEDDVKVTIGNIKTGAPSYMGPGMNLSLKPARGYGLTTAIKLPPKGINAESLSGYNIVPVVEPETDILKDKPWKKPGADLSDYFNYGFNEETWKGYCEKQRRLQLGLGATVLLSFDKMTVPQGRAAIVEDTETPSVKNDFKSDFPPSVMALSTNRLKAGPPPNRKMGGTIDVIGGHTGAIRRVEGRRREMQEQNPIQVLGDHMKPKSIVSTTGPPPSSIGMPPPHFLHPPPSLPGMAPPVRPPGIPPPSIAGLFPPPLAPPPTLLMPPSDSNRPLPPLFGYNRGDPSFTSYPPVSSSQMSWSSPLDKGPSMDGGCGHWDYQGQRERDRERDRTPTSSEYNEDSRYRFYGHDREGDREYDTTHQGQSRDREEHSRDRRHSDKEESSKHKSSKRKPHDDEGDGHRRHKHKKSKRIKEDKEALADMLEVYND